MTVSATEHIDFPVAPLLTSTEMTAVFKTTLTTMFHTDSLSDTDFHWRNQPATVIKSTAELLLHKSGIIMVYLLWEKLSCFKKQTITYLLSAEFFIIYRICRVVLLPGSNFGSFPGVCPFAVCLRRQNLFKDTEVTLSFQWKFSLNSFPHLLVSHRKHVQM